PCSRDSSRGWDSRLMAWSSLRRFLDWCVLIGANQRRITWRSCFDWASLSLNGAELPPPTVGGSPLTSGGHVVPCSGDVFSVGCASATLAGATPTNAAMIRMIGRKRQFLAQLPSVDVNVSRRKGFPKPCSGERASGR